jgi:glycine hydroxymethyltransferase
MQKKQSFLQRYLSQVPQEKQNSGAIAFFASLDEVEKVSPIVAKTVCKELSDQRKFLKLIASENFSSLAVQCSMGNLLTDKYSEGYSHHRFYAGCENVDVVEEEAATLAKELFKTDHAYVQPHSGSDANLVALWSILISKIQNKEIEKLGKKNLDELSAKEYESIRNVMVHQKVMGMSLASGGHLTHGYRHNISSKFMQAVLYDVDPKTHLIDYDRLQTEVLQEKPLVLMAGYSSYPRLIDFAKMRSIADSVGAVLLVDMAHFAGLVAGKAIQGVYDPAPYADIITSTTHKTLRGPRGGLVLCKEEFKDVVNKGCPIVLGGPMPHVMAAKAVAFKEASRHEFQEYAKQIIINAKTLAEELMSQGVKVTTNGTDNHLIVFDTEQSFSLTGRQAEKALRRAGLTVNRNMIPQDKHGPWYCSGIRLGTPAVTTLGMKAEEMKEIASIIASLLKATKPGVNPKTGGPSLAHTVIDENQLEEAKGRVKDLLSQFPLYPELTLDQSFEESCCT